MSEAIALLSGSIGLLALVLVAVLAFKLVQVIGQLGDVRVADATKAGQLVIAEANIATYKKRGDDETQRADILDDELAKSDADLDPAGARDRVLQAWRAARARADADRAAPIAVPTQPAPAAAEPADLGASRV